MGGWSKRAAIAAMLLTAAARPPAPACPAEVRARTPTEIVARLDNYHFAPRDPGTYRALAGLDDPGIAPNDGDYLDYRLTDAERGLLVLMQPGHDRGGSSWHVFGTCRPAYAMRVFAARIDRFGSRHPYVAHWLGVQRAVFAACVEPGQRGPAALPPPMPTSDPAVARLQHDDRAYQEAALLFYRRDPRARAQFAAIARTSSPHAAIARYMTVAIDARDMAGLRFGTPQEVAARQSQVARVLAGARAILADPALAEVHPLAQGLIGYVGYWSGEPRTRRAQVRLMLEALAAPAGRLAASPAARDRYARAASDILVLRRDFPDESWWLTGAIPPEANAFRALAAEAARNPMATWLVFPVSPFERQPWIRVASLSHWPWAMLRQRADDEGRRDQGAAWETVRASIAEEYRPEGWRRIDRLTAEIADCPSDDRLAAAPSLFYHQVRTALMYPAYGADERQRNSRAAFAALLRWPWRGGRHFQGLVSDVLQYLVAEGRIAEARAVRDGSARREFPYDDAVALLLLAEDEDHFAAELAAANLTGQAESLLNLLGAPELARLAARSDVPAEMRARFARTAWARLYALERPIPLPLDRLMRRLNPEITAGWTSRPGARPGSRSLLLDVLRSPGLNILITDHQRQVQTVNPEDAGLTRIDVYEHSDNNWWCAWQPERHARLTAESIYDAFFAPPDHWREPLAAAGSTAAVSSLLHASWLWSARDEAEQAALARIPSAPQMLARRAIAWRGGNWFSRLRGHPGQDEALALAVRATRYGCQRQGGHGAWSRAAFTLLHRRFPLSDPARRTRYWFDCAHFSGGCGRRQSEEARIWGRY